MNTFLGAIHRLVARTRLGAVVAIKIRNQAAAAVRAHLNDGIVLSRNGEFWLISQVAPVAAWFVDVGANTGAWSKAFLEQMPGGKGILFEPSPVAAEILRENLLTVSGSSRVEIIEAAVSDEPGKALFYMEAEAGETSSLLVRHSDPGAKAIWVSVTTLDDELEKRNIPFVDVMKVDAEGLDLRVIKGATRAIRAGRIGIIQFEYNDPWRYAGSTLAEALQFFAEHAYQVLLLKRDGLHEFDYETFGEYYGYSNFVAISQRYRETGKLDSAALLGKRHRASRVPSAGTSSAADLSPIA